MWLIPTRKRPQQMRELIASMEATGCVPECAVMIDGEFEDYQGVEFPAHWHVHASHGHLELQRAWNTLFRLYPNEKTYGLIGDHTRPESPDWATRLEEAAGDWNTSSCHDYRSRFNRVTGLRRMSAANVLGGELARELGYVWPDFCVHLAGDDALELIWHHLGLEVRLEDVKVRDLHFIDGEIPIDENHDRVWQGVAYAEADEKAFHNWREHVFPGLVKRLETVIPMECRKPSLLTVCCVKWGDGYGPEYVNILYDMVRRNLPQLFPGRFVCFTEDPEGIDPGIEIRPLPVGLSGWWNKLALFKSGVFKPTERVLYIDLDTVIMGALDEIARYDGQFASLRDFYRSDGIGSGVMAWPGGFGSEIWEKFEAQGFPQIEGGDQAFIESMGIEAVRLQDAFPGLICSFKKDCIQGPPLDTGIVCFHGEPKPDNCNSPWVERIWKVGGVTSAKILTYCNVSEKELLENIADSSRRPLLWLTEEDPHDGTAVIVGGGPSLMDTIDQIKARSRSGQTIFALNNAAKTLIENGIKVDYQVIIDARGENIKFVTPPLADKYLIASQSSPAIFDALKNEAVTLFHVAIHDLRRLLPPNRRNTVCVGGGTTVLTRAMVAVHLMGYRWMHLYGVDSSFRGGEHHAYPQDMNNDRPSEVLVDGQAFQSCPWMMAQVNEFQQVSAFLAEENSTISVHGDGLLPFVAKCMMAA